MEDVCRNLGFAIVQRAVEDYRMLELAGVIKGGRVIDEWPMWNGGSLIVDLEYNSRIKVVELVNWFLSGQCKRILSALDAEINHKMLLHELGLREK